MRTLKKTLSLVLVVAMVLGLCVVGASAKNAVDDFTDADKIGDAYYEAVGVMTGIGVIKGMGDGTLSPTGYYTRAQAAKIITYMLIGEKAAESLVCTTAPFEDVAANHWAAGYIAFCVEQGIINGMSATTFEPEGQLTGFQWAKMLLCAVGFGSQGEFTGNSWSLNTAKVAHNVGLFTGDLAGADHVALQRQQAMLYAFNVLTTVPQVTYSPNVSGYIEGIWGYVTVSPLGQTLGQSIYSLASVTGVVVDNEGMGASATYVSTVATDKVVKVVAGTGLDMMYHAARVWYVEGTKANTGVFVLDLAKVETTECPSATAIAALKAPATIGDKVNGAAYQLDVVDNSAIDAGKTNVVFYYNYNRLGVRSTAKDTTVIPAGGKAVANADIKTDISAIKQNDPIIYLAATSTKEDGEAWYVYTPTATTGVVTKVENKTETITLRDGTVLKKSNLAPTNLAPVLGQEYTFVLDTHGHVISISRSINLVFYTGAYTRTFGTYVGEETYTIQVVDVMTGNNYTVPVLGNWTSRTGDAGDDNLFGIAEAVPGYYVLGQPTLDGFYRPTLWTLGTTPAPNPLNSGLGYSHYWQQSVRVSSTTDSVDAAGTYLYDPATVQFVVVRNNGTDLVVDVYNGVADLLANYGPVAASSVTFGGPRTSGVVASYSVNSTQTNEVSVIFSVEGTYWSRYLFIPYDIEATDGNWAAETTWGGRVFAYEDAGYVNGVQVDIAANSTTDYERGFYAYTVDRNGYYWLAPVLPNEWAYEDANIVSYGAAGAKTYFQVNKSGDRVRFASNAVILDVRSQVLAGNVDAVTSLEGLYDNFADFMNATVQFAYTFNTDLEIAVLYIVDRNLGRVTLTEGENWTEADTWQIEDFECIRSGSHEYEDAVTFTLAPSGNYKLAEGAKVEVWLELTAVDRGSLTNTYYKATGTADKDGKVDVSFKTSDFKDSLGNPYSGDYWYDVEIADVLFPKFTVSLDSSIASKFALTTAIDGDWTTEVEIDDLAPSQTFAIGFTRTAAANLAATVKATGTPAASYPVTFNSVGQENVSYVPTKVENIVVTAIDAVITLDMGTSDQVPAKNFEFKNGLEGANYDKWTDTVTAGDTVTFVVKRSGEAIPSQYDGHRLKINTLNSGYVLSVESVSKDSTNGNANAEFTFTLQPGGNNVKFTGAEWTKETQNSEGTVQG